MAKRSRRRTSASKSAKRMSVSRMPARGATSIKKSLTEAQHAIGGYVRSGSKQVNDAVSTFLSKFDTGHLLDALSKKMRGGSPARRPSGRRSTATSRRRTTTKSKTRRAAASTKVAVRRSSRRK